MLSQAKAGYPAKLNQITASYSDSNLQTSIFFSLAFVSVISLFEIFFVKKCLESFSIFKTHEKIRPA